jgi:hypothetical protein
METVFEKYQKQLLERAQFIYYENPISDWCGQWLECGFSGAPRIVKRSESQFLWSLNV